MTCVVYMHSYGLLGYYGVLDKTITYRRERFVSDAEPA